MSEAPERKIFCSAKRKNGFCERQKWNVNKLFSPVVEDIH